MWKPEIMGDRAENTEGEERYREIGGVGRIRTCRGSSRILLTVEK